MYYIAFPEYRYELEECYIQELVLFLSSKPLDITEIYTEYREYKIEKNRKYTENREKGPMKYLTFYTWLARNYKLKRVPKRKITVWE